MPNNKQNGCYYTPKILSDFLIEHICKNYHMPKELNILEPSCGSGNFIKSILAKIDELPFSQIDISLVEIDDEELKKTVDLVRSFNKKVVNLNAYNCDFLDYHKKNEDKYTLIVGNPPYIKKSLLSEPQIKSCIEIFSEAGLPTKHIKNIWPAFLLSSILNLEENGILCLVLPSELLQVKYSKQLREYILSNFEKIEIFAFNELVFEAVAQDIIILIGAKKVQNDKDKGIYFYQVEKLEDLNNQHFVQKSTNVHRKTLNKWTNYILEDQDLSFIDNLSASLKRLEFYCDKVNVGIVTAANSYFIVNNQIIKENNLQKYAKPILANSINLKKTLLFTNEDYNLLKSTNRKVNFIKFPNLEKGLLDKESTDYINYGESIETNAKYKCKLRENWYYIPSVWVSEGFFMRRSSHFPVIFVNNMSVNVTDCFYRINMKSGFNIRNLSFSFLNTLTLVLAELEGRYYGGGVLELTPKEFASLYIPYYEGLSDREFNRLEEMLRDKEPINKILSYTDKILLKKVLNLEDTDISRLRTIYETLVRRRKKRPTIFKE